MGPTINPDSSIILFNEREIPKETIRDLIDNLNQDNYEEQELVEEYLLGESDTFEVKDTILIPSELKNIIKNSIETERVNNEYLQIQNLEKLETDIKNNADRIISILNETRQIPSVSSYLVVVSIYLRWEHEKLIIFQKYPGGNNIKWSIIDDGKSIMNLYNPRLNSLINDFLPIRLRESIKLTLFDKELRIKK